MEKYAKAIVALVVVAASLVVGDDVSSEIDVEGLEIAIVSVLSSLSVFVVPNKGA